MTIIPDLPDFSRIFLVDQLCGSGTTVLREEPNKWSGKIPRFFEIWSEKTVGKRVYYCPYIISTAAEKRMETLLKSYSDKFPRINISQAPTSAIPISGSIAKNGADEIDETKPASKLCQEYQSKIKKDEHITVGGNPTYGFGGAGLTLVFQSNCPNNSLPILWNGDNGWYPLFPRVKHHEEVG